MREEVWAEVGLEVRAEVSAELPRVGSSHSPPPQPEAPPLTGSPVPRVLLSCHDEASKFVQLLGSPGRAGLGPENFRPLLEVRGAGPGAGGGVRGGVRAGLGPGDNRPLLEASGRGQERGWGPCWRSGGLAWGGVTAGGGVRGGVRVGTGPG